MKLKFMKVEIMYRNELKCLFLLKDQPRQWLEDNKDENYLK